MCMTATALFPVRNESSFRFNISRPDCVFTKLAVRSKSVSPRDSWFQPSRITNKLNSTHIYARTIDVEDEDIERGLDFLLGFRGILDRGRHYAATSFLDSHPGPTIVYAAVPRQVELLIRAFQDQHIQAATYHEEMTGEERQQAFYAFVDGRVDCVSGYRNAWPLTALQY